MRFLLQYTVFCRFAPARYPFLKRRGTKGGFTWSTREDAYIFTNFSEIPKCYFNKDGRLRKTYKLIVLH